MRRRAVGWGAALCLLAGTAGAAEVQADWSGLEFDGDEGILSGDIEVGGQLVGDFELQVRRVIADEDGLTLVGDLQAHTTTQSETLHDVSFTLSDASGLCETAAATPDDVKLPRLGMVIYGESVDLDLAADTAHGRAMASSVCAATHLLDDPRGPLAAAAADLVAIVNRQLGYQRDAIAGARRSAAPPTAAHVTEPVRTAAPVTATLSAVPLSVVPGTPSSLSVLPKLEAPLERAAAQSPGGGGARPDVAPTRSHTLTPDDLDQ